MSPPHRILAVAVLLAPPGAAAQEETLAGSAARVAEIARVLPERPEGLGPPRSDRDAWARVAAGIDLKALRESAARAAATPPAPFDQDLYRDFSRTGVRRRYERAYFARWSAVSDLALAEVLEDQGRYLAALQAALSSVLADPTWVLPAHDRDLANLEGRRTDIDLFSSAAGRILATVHTWLADRLDPALAARIRRELDRRLWAPLLDMIQGRRPPNGWLRTTSNWNAVCWANAVIAALAVLESRDDRARLLAAAESNLRHYRSGFTRDGWCSEGMGYWNYGFGHYMLLADAALRATGGRVDLLSDPQVASIASFGRRTEIVGGCFPSFSDCSTDAQPDPDLMDLIDWHFSGTPPPARPRPARDLTRLLALSFPSRPATPRPARPASAGLRDWFEDAGVLIARPAEGTRGRFGVALKGGHNAEHHNHNDVGSYIVVVGGVPVLTDPGAEVYTAATFDRRRYESPANNSFGHPVPRLGRTLQATGRRAEARLVETRFSSEEDRVTFDLKAAYAVPSLLRLTRTFVYSRTDGGSLEVRDSFESSEPLDFETALVTFGRLRRLDAETLEISDRDRTVRVRLAGSRGPGSVSETPLEADYRAGRRAIRIGIALPEAASSGTLTILVRPSP